MRPVILATVAAILCAVSGGAAAQEKAVARPAPPTIVASPLALAIAGFDRDGDSIVSRAEYDAGVARTFAGHDGNGDGQLSLLEFSSWAEADLGNNGALPGRFEFDRDGDDRISRSEFSALFAARFAALDTDKNDALRRSELVSFAALPARERREQRQTPQHEPR